MGTVLSFSQKDSRILELCHTYFPNSPEFAKYLADRITAFDGSVELAWVFCTTLLAQCKRPISVVSPDCVTKLSVDHIPNAVGVVNKAYPDGWTKVLDNVFVFRVRLDGTVVAPRGTRSFEDLTLKSRTSVSNSPDKRALIRVFYCAQAMLAGVDIDPRADAT